MRKLPAVLLCTLLYWGISKKSFSQINPYHYQSYESEMWADSIMQTLSEDEKIAQLFMIYTETTWADANLKFYHKQLREYCPGGIILFKGGPQTAKNFVKASQRLAKVPLLVGVDGEYGLSMRMDSFPAIPYNMVLGAIRDNRIIIETGKYIGKQCYDIGAHLNFAPVIDINNNPKNPVINYRSFGEVPFNVINKGYAINYGLKLSGITGVGKHFPGHGNTSVDSHYALPLIEGDYKQLMENELRPFKQLSKRGVTAMMVGHLQVPGLDDSGLPATLSPKIVSGVLKDSLNFNGLVITDGMNMASVAKGFDQPFVKAIKAGNDILLLPAVYSKAFNEVKSALEKNQIELGTIENRCRRILQAKYHILNPQLENDSSYHDWSTALKHKIYKNAVTLVKNQNRILPFREVGSQSVALVENGMDSEFNSKVDFYDKTSHFILGQNKEEINTLVNKLKNYDQVIIGLHGSITSSRSNYGIKKEWVTLLDRLAPFTNVHVVLMANPYALNEITQQAFDEIKSLIVSYSDDKLAQSYAAQVLYGGIPALGKLSVSISDKAKAGEGLFTSPIRIGFSAPCEKQVKGNLSDSIQEIVSEALKNKATPGCQVLVAKDGDIIYQKSFGYHTYKKERKVQNTDLYDLASVTKISATIPLIMLLDEQNKIAVQKPLGYYLPRLDGTNKANLSLRNVLRHTAGLEAYIPFQFVLADKKSVEKYGMFSRHYSSTFNTKIDKYTYISKYLRFYKGMLSPIPTSKHKLKVANNLYIRKDFADTIVARLDSSDVSLDGKYKYSDLGYYYLQDIIEKIEGLPLDELAQENFYGPLGMHYTCFNPLHSFSKNQITPTEKDRYFRKQTIHGYVHDQGAALSGGVAGHAGLFSNAGDLSKIFQMYLNGGTYGGKQYLDWHTVQHYTTDTQGEGRRALGFDKPESDPDKYGPTCSLVSPSSYGHSGFTGTYVWVDPTYQLIYIFLSNRVHPDVWNRKLISEDIRTRIQEKIYNCILP